MKEKLVEDNGDSLVRISKKKWCSMRSPFRICDKLAEKMLIKFAESGCPIFRVTEVNSKAKDMEHCRFTLQSFQKQLTLSHNCLCQSATFTQQIAKMCEGYETLHDRSGRPGVVVGQSIVLNAIKTDVPYCNSMDNE